MKNTFYSNGKLLITGEYLVLDGAKALALPTKFGQNLTVEKADKQQITWRSFDFDGSIWFEDTILFSEISNPQHPISESVRSTLITILHQAYRLHPDFITFAEGYSITTQLSFPRKWGLGTSSTLINNIAQWLAIDPFVLLNNSFGGSGYDIACAQNDTPILYHLEQGKPVTEKVVFCPPFAQNLYFVYLNKKQSSKSAIATYKSQHKDNLQHIITENDNRTKNVLHAETLEQFTAEIVQMETSMSAVLKTPTIKESLFPDFEGTIKSLGAWGGDFVLVIAKYNPSSYFMSKGYETVIPYNEMILQQ